MRKTLSLSLISLMAMLFLAQYVGYCKVQDSTGRYLESWKVKVLKTTTAPQLYLLKGEKYDLEALAKYIKKLHEEKSDTLRILWRIEIETAESYESIQELAEVLKYYKYSSIKIAPAG